MPELSHHCRLKTPTHPQRYTNFLSQTHFTTLIDDQDESANTEARKKARHAILAALPIPSNMPTDTLIPIVIPAPFSIHDFLGTVQGVSLLISLKPLTLIPLNISGLEE